MDLEIPEDFKNRLDQSGAFDLFRALPPAEQASHIKIIEEQKKVETREKQIGKCVHLIRSGLPIPTPKPAGTPKKKKKK